jgi:hypothetical protein
VGGKKLEYVQVVAAGAKWGGIMVRAAQKHTIKKTRNVILFMLLTS